MRVAGLVDGDEEFDSKAIAAAAHGVMRFNEAEFC
jgi:hypothetical protein